MNFDGFVNTFTQSSGIGGIIRDDKGEMVAAFVEGVATTHPLVTELQALLKGVSFSNTFNISKIIH